MPPCLRARTLFVKDMSLVPITLIRWFTQLPSNFTSTGPSASDLYGHQHSLVLTHTQIQTCAIKNKLEETYSWNVQIVSCLVLWTSESGMNSEDNPCLAICKSQLFSSQDAFLQHDRGSCCQSVGHFEFMVVHLMRRWSYRSLWSCGISKIYLPEE